MEREIKFRARNAKVPRCWIYGYSVVEYGKHCIINDDGKFPVIAGSECQYTGQNDKNGKEIWEGDIVNIKSTYETDTLVDCNATVLFRDGRFTTDYHDLQVCGFTKLGNWEGEVIGNRWDNPELLKERNES